ncbi:hypothetical protein [Nonomuraea sp. NPDC049158]|uniref:hypothetical protein n=1 Tax=Nonomuraea sp. NPDC049158 TaxID=3155649 RepID=UPI00341148E3
MSLANLIYLILRLLMGSLLIVGVVLTAKAKAEHGRAATLGMFGCIALLFPELISIVRLFSLDSLIRAVGVNSFNIVLAAIETISTLITAVGVGLLIWAVVARRTPAQPPPEWQPQSPPQPPPSQQPGWQDPERPGWQNPQG